MNSPESDPNPSADEQQLGEIIDEIVDAIRDGQAVVVDDWVKRYPQHEKELRDLMPALIFAEDIQRNSTARKTSESSFRTSVNSNALVSEPCPEKLGDFEIRHELGRGGMGVVYSAWQQSLRRPVALKVLARHLTRDSRFVARFQREAQSAARLNHPNLVQVYGIGQDEGVWYYTMQLIDGSTISDVLHHLSSIQKGGQTTVELHQSPLKIQMCAESLLFNDLTQLSQVASLDWSIDSANASESQEVPVQRPSSPSGQSLAELSWGGISSAKTKNRLPYFANVAALIRDVATAIHYAHTQGTIHRDIKPSNLLLDRSGKIWITDFGLAKIEEEAGLTMSGDVIGTLRYTAPEQLDGVSAPSCDIFSLGLTLYELLTLQPAIAATDRLHILYQVREQVPTPPRAIDPRVPLDLETITLKAIAKEPRNRYSSAQEFADDLDRFLDGRPILARPVSSLDKVVSWSRRNRLVAALLLMLLIGLIVASVGSTLAAIRFRDLATLEANSRLEADKASKHATAAETEMRRQLYISEMSLGLQSAKLPGSLPKLRRFVQRWRDNAEADGFRGWEWKLLNSLTQQELFKFSVECRTDSRLTMSADRQTIAWIEDDRLVAYSIGIQKEIQSFKRDRRGILYINLSSNGRRLLAALDDGEVVVFSVDNGEIEFSQKLPSRSSSAAWHPNGREIVFVVPQGTTGRGDLHHWNLQSGETKIALKQDVSLVATNIAFNADGSRLAATRCSDPKFNYIVSVCVWNSNSWEVEAQKLIEASRTSSYCWSPDGTKIAVGTFEGDVWIWNIQTNTFDSTLKLLRSVRDLDWHPSGEFLCVGCDDATVLQWYPATQKLRDSPLPHDDAVSFSRYGGEGDWLVSLDQSNTIRVWDIKSGLAEQQHQLANQFDAHQVDVLVEFSPSDKQISAGAAAPASVWQTSDGRLLKTITGSYLNWSFDGRYLASKFNETVTVWDADSFMEHTTNEQLGYGILRVWSPIDYRLSGNDSKGLWIWNVQTKAVQRSEKPITPGGPDSFKAIAWSPDGKLIAVVANVGNLYLVDSETLECKYEYKPTTATIHAVAWSPDSKYLVVAAAQPSAIIVAAETGDVVKRLDAHSYEVRSVAWSKDGKRIATGGADRQLMVWNPDWELPVLSMEFDSEVRSVGWSHDNRMLAGLSQNGQLRLWKANK